MSDAIAAVDTSQKDHRNQTLFGRWKRKHRPGLHRFGRNPFVRGRLRRRSRTAPPMLLVPQGDVETVPEDDLSTSKIQRTTTRSISENGKDSDSSCSGDGGSFVASEHKRVASPFGFLKKHKRKDSHHSSKGNRDRGIRRTVKHILKSKQEEEIKSLLKTLQTSTDNREREEAWRHLAWIAQNSESGREAIFRQTGIPTDVPPCMIIENRTPSPPKSSWRRRTCHEATLGAPLVFFDGRGNTAFNQRPPSGPVGNAGTIGEIEMHQTGSLIGKWHLRGKDRTPSPMRRKVPSPFRRRRFPNREQSDCSSNLLASELLTPFPRMQSPLIGCNNGVRSYDSIKHRKQLDEYKWLTREVE